MDRSPLPPRQIILLYAYVQDFHSGGLCKLWAPNSLHTGVKDAMSIQIPFNSIINLGDFLTPTNSIKEQTYFNAKFCYVLCLRSCDVRTEFFKTQKA